MGEEEMICCLGLYGTQEGARAGDERFLVYKCLETEEISQGIAEGNWSSHLANIFFLIETIYKFDMVNQKMGENCFSLYKVIKSDNSTERASTWTDVLISPKHCRHHREYRERIK